MRAKYILGPSFFWRLHRRESDILSLQTVWPPTYSITSNSGPIVVQISYPKKTYLAMLGSPPAFLAARLQFFWSPSFYLLRMLHGSLQILVLAASHNKWNILEHSKLLFGLVQNFLITGELWNIPTKTFTSLCHLTCRSEIVIVMHLLLR